EVLGEEIDRPSIHRSPAGDDAVARNLRFLHAEFVRAMFDEHVEFLEGTLVEDELDAFAGGQLAPLVLGLDARLAAAETGFLTALLKSVEDVLHSALTVPVTGSESRPPEAYHERPASSLERLGRHLGDTWETLGTAFKDCLQAGHERASDRSRA